MAWQPDIPKMIVSGFVTLGGIWLLPVLPVMAGFMIAGGLIYAFAAGTGVFLGNVAPTIAASKDIAEALKPKGK